MKYSSSVDPSCDFLIYIPDDVRFILWAPNLGTVGLFPLPRPIEGLALVVVGTGAAIAAHGSLSSSAPPFFTFKGFAEGAGAAMAPHGSSSSPTVLLDLVLDGWEELALGEGAVAGTDPHKSSSSFLLTFGVILPRKPVTEANVVRMRKQK